MGKIFNTEADCKPELHYMVDISDRLRSIEDMIDHGKYFTINRGRQYGKTTTLRVLANHLRDKYLVVSLDFQDLDSSDFSSVEYFAEAFADLFYNKVKKSNDLPQDLLNKLKDFAGGQIPRANLRKLFSLFKKCCEKAKHPIVLLIDEVDTASNNQVFLDFLAKLRAGYINRDSEATFQSVILAGVYDIKNLKRKFVNEGEHSENSPWNISAAFDVDMDFSPEQIAGMLRAYETDHRTGMDIHRISQLIYEYTSGYPVLVSGICKRIDEELIGTRAFPNAASAWTYEGVTEAVGILLKSSSPLFESMIRQITQTPELGEMLKSTLFEGESVAFNPDNTILSLASMFGYVKSENGQVKVSNRIFETRLYNYFLSLV
ncbi:MAG: ATP-binding protein [Lachnospiraceae bacterium]|nr:ATP-binding protein [Lachnospiraceae bacterium]